MKLKLALWFALGTIFVLGSARPSVAANGHTLHGTLDATAEDVAPPTGGTCGAVLYDMNSIPDQIVAACSNDSDYNKWIAETAKSAPCTSDDAAITTGTQVVIRNAKHQRVALTKLRDGVYTKDQGTICEFSFTTKIPDSTSYEIEVGNAGFVTFSKKLLQKHAWLAPLKARG